MKKKQLNILLAEDDKDDHLFFERALKELKVSVNLTTVMDGEQLMKYLAKHSEELPDILFLDLNMPRKNGFESLVEIRGIENFNELPIVILSTSFPQDKDYEMGMIKQLFNLGACVFIRKPKDPKELTQLISQAVYLATENTGMKSILNA